MKSEKMKKYLKSLASNYSSEVAKKVYDMYQYTPNLFYAIEDSIESKHYNLATSLPILIEEKKENSNTPALLKKYDDIANIGAVSAANHELILEKFVLSNLDFFKHQLNNLKKLKIKSHNKYAIAVCFNGEYDYELQKQFLKLVDFYDINLSDIDLKKFFINQDKSTHPTQQAALLYQYENITQKYFKDIASEFHNRQLFLNLIKFENEGIDSIYWLNINTSSYNQYTHISYNKFRAVDDILVKKNKINFSKKTKKIDNFFIFQNNFFLSHAPKQVNQDKKSLIFYTNKLEIENDTPIKIHFYEDILNYHLVDTDIHYNQDILLGAKSQLNYLTHYHCALNDKVKNVKHFKHNILSNLNKDSNLNFNYLSENLDFEQVDVYFDLYHKFENTHSKTHFQSINQGKNIFNINTTLEKRAKKSSTHQKTHNLLIKNSAQSISQPNLHVFNPDVVATHGSATSKFDESNIIYLKSRGLNDETIQSLLISSVIKNTLNKFIDELGVYDKSILLKLLGVENESI
jgi:hypothetical protein